MKRALLLIPLLLLTSCSIESKESEPPTPPASTLPATNVQVITDWSEPNNWGFREVRVNGIKCIETHYGPTARSIACNISGIGQ